MEDHVHVADRPDRAVGVLAIEGEVIRVLALLLSPLNPGFMSAGGRRNEEGLAVGGLVFQQLLDEIGLVLQMGEIFLSQLLALAVELVGEALEEQHAEDEFLKFRGIHLAPAGYRRPTHYQKLLPLGMIPAAALAIVS